MSALVPFIIIGATLLLLGTLALIFAGARHHTRGTYRSRQDHWDNVIKPRMTHQHQISRGNRIEERESLIRSHYTRRLKRAERRANRSGKHRHIMKWLDLSFMADREVKLDRRMHGIDPVAGKDAKKRIPKIHPKTGHITGGIGREGTKASHAHNPHPKRVMKPKQKKTGSGGGRIRKAIIGDMKPAIPVVRPKRRKR